MSLNPSRNSLVKTCDTWIATTLNKEGVSQVLNTSVVVLLNSLLFELLKNNTNDTNIG